MATEQGTKTTSVVTGFRVIVRYGQQICCWIVQIHYCSGPPGTKNQYTFFIICERDLFLPSDRRHYSIHLPQVGLEISCTLIFTGDKDTMKITELLINKD